VIIPGQNTRIKSCRSSNWDAVLRDGLFCAPDWRLPELLGPPYWGNPLPSIAFDGNGITHTLNFDKKSKPDVGF